jgi:putative NADPH-quinone reductase
VKTLVIYAHPYERSFCSALLARCLETLGEEADLIDLYKDGFNPVMSRDELALYSTGGSVDPLVGDYQKRIAAARRLVFIFPIWWYDAPAILRGFFDKVFLKDFAFDDSNGFDGLLDQEALLVTCSGDFNKGIQGAVRPLFLEHLFPSVGIRNPRWMNCETVQEDEEARKSFLTEVAAALT